MGRGLSASGRYQAPVASAGVGGGGVMTYTPSRCTGRQLAAHCWDGASCLLLAHRRQRLSDWHNEPYTRYCRTGHNVAATQAVLRLLSSFRSLACAVRGMTSAGHRWSVQGDK